MLYIWASITSITRNAVSILNQIVNARSRLCLRLIFSVKFQGDGVGVLPLLLMGETPPKLDTKVRISGVKVSHHRKGPLINTQTHLYMVVDCKTVRFFWRIQVRASSQTKGLELS